MLNALSTLDGKILWDKFVDNTKLVRDYKIIKSSEIKIMYKINDYSHKHINKIKLSALNN